MRRARQFAGHQQEGAMMLKRGDVRHGTAVPDPTSAPPVQVSRSLAGVAMDGAHGEPQLGLPAALVAALVAGITLDQALPGLGWLTMELLCDPHTLFFLREHRRT